MRQFRLKTGEILQVGTSHGMAPPGVPYSGQVVGVYRWIKIGDRDWIRWTGIGSTLLDLLANSECFTADDVLQYIEVYG